VEIPRQTSECTERKEKDRTTKGKERNGSNCGRKKKWIYVCLQGKQDRGVASPGGIRVHVEKGG